MSGPETTASIGLLPLTKDQGAIDPFERRMRKQACWRRSSIRSGRSPPAQILGAADDDERERRRQPHRDHVGLDELAEPDAGIEAFGRDIDQFLACGDLHLDLGIGLAEGCDQRLQQDRHDRARHREAQQPGRPLSEVTRDLACGDELLEGGLCAREESVRRLRSGRRCASCA